MGKTLLIFLFIMGSLSAKAQRVEHVTINARYFDPETMEFFTPLANGRYTITTLDLQGYTHNLVAGNQSVKLKRYLAKQHKKTNGIVDLQHVTKVYESGYGPHFKNLLFEYSATDTTHRSYSIKIVNPDYALVRSAVVNQKNQTQNYSIFVSYKAIIINNLLTLYYIRDGAYTIIDTGKNFNIYAYTVGSNINGRYRIPLPHRFNVVYKQEDLSPAMRHDYPGGSTFKENGKTGLKVGSQIILPAVYDAIATSKSFIIATADKNIQLFYRNGDSIPISGIRAAYSQWILKGNTIYSVDATGNIIPPVEEPVRYERENTFDLNGRTAIIKRKDGWKMQYTAPPSPDRGPRYIYVEKPVNYSIVTGDYFKAITLLNGSTACECLSTYYLIAETQDGLKALLIRQKNTLQEGWRENYRVALEAGNYTFTYDEQRRDLKFEKGKLFGYWPMHNAVRYTALDTFNKGFARFTLPNGKQGWLSLDGKEYLDE
ncbi:MAG: hypothetical protein V4581_17445 [Bacteroidota bacterium]